jgi:hypothetical protein
MKGRVLHTHCSLSATFSTVSEETEVQVITAEQMKPDPNYRTFDRHLCGVCLALGHQTLDSSQSQSIDVFCKDPVVLPARLHGDIAQNTIKQESSVLWDVNITDISKDLMPSSSDGRSGLSKHCGPHSITSQKTVLSVTTVTFAVVYLYIFTFCLYVDLLYIMKICCKINDLKQSQNVAFTRRRSHLYVTEFPEFPAGNNKQ